MLGSDINMKYKQTVVLTLLIGCSIAQVALADGVNKHIHFEKGHTSITLKESVIRADVDKYVITARKGQRMSLRIRSVEDNAVFAVYTPDGKRRLNDKDGYGESPDAKKWHGVLPVSGDFTIEVSGTRDNASYELSVKVTD